MSYQDYDGRHYKNPGYSFRTSQQEYSDNESYRTAYEFYPEGGTHHRLNYPTRKQLQAVRLPQKLQQERERRPDCECSIVSKVLIALIVISVVTALIGTFVAVFLTYDVNTFGKNTTALPTIDTNNIAVTPTSATIRLNNIFTNLSASARYSLFVATSPDQSQLNESNTWAAVQGLVPQPPYVAVYRCANLFSAGADCPTVTRAKRQTSNSVSLTLGGDNTCNSTAANVYCNGPLKPNTNYYVSYRAHDKDVSYDSPFSPPIATAVSQSGTDRPQASEPKPSTVRVAATAKIATTEAQKSPAATSKSQTTKAATIKSKTTEPATDKSTEQAKRTRQITTTVAKTTQLPTTEAQTTKMATVEPQITIITKPETQTTKMATTEAQKTQKATTETQTTIKATTDAKTTKMATTEAQATKIATTAKMITKVATTVTQATQMAKREDATTVLTTPEVVPDVTDPPTTTMSQTTVQDTPLPTIVFDNSTITAVSAIISVNNNFKNLSSSAQYSVIVATNPNDTQVNDSNTWASVQGMKPQPPYIALHKCDSFFTLSTHDSCQVTRRTRRSTVSLLPLKDVHLGKERTCDVTAKDVYCNGQLTPEKQYYVKIRAYDGGAHYDSPYSPPIMTAALGEWEDWGEWGSCDITCGGGIQKRNRTCKQGGFCLGQNIQSKGCNKQSCPRQASSGKWKSWSSWSYCSVTCGGGSRNRSRLCDQGQHQNLTCVGDNSQVLGCAPWRCPNCSYQCPNGTLNRPNCTHCECDTTAPVEGKVMSEQGLALNQVQLVLADAPSVTLYTTGPSGNFTLLNLCPYARVMFMKKGYSSQAVQMRNTMNVVNMETLVSLSMDVHPASKKRLLGDDVQLCCSASGNPPPDYYEWFRNGVQIMGQTGTTLSLLNLTKNDAGWYKCRANTDAKAVYSEEAALNVRENADDFCPNNPEKNLQQLPDGCTFNDSTFYDVGKCENLRCHGQEVNKDTCNDELTYCCAGSQYQRINIECDGFNYTVDKVMECGCFQCPEPIVEIQGFVFDADTNEAIKDIDIYRNKTYQTTTDSNGQFNLKVPQGTLRLALTARQSKNINVTRNTTYGESTNIVILKEYADGVFYTAFKLNRVMRLPSFNSSQTNTIGLMGKSNKTVVDINISADSVYDEEGNIFKGEVTPEINVIDPRDELSLLSAPGDFTSRDDEGQLRTLQTYGMFTVSFSSNNGKRLQILKSLIMKIPTSVLGNYTNYDNNRLEDIKLWNLNEQGIWEIEKDLKPPSKKRRRKRNVDSLQVSIPDITITSELRWYNLDAVTTTICYSKVRVYENDDYNLFKQKKYADVLALVKGSDETYSMSRVRPNGDSDDNGYCVLHRCDSPRNSGPHIGFRGLIIAQLEGKNLIPASVSLPQSLHNSLNYNASSDRIEVDFDLIKIPNNNKGPFYDWGPSSLRNADTCVNAPPSEPHFKFHLHKEDQCYQRVPETDPIQEPKSTCQTHYYKAWHTTVERRSQQYTFCFMKVKLGFSSTNLKVKAFSRVGNMQYDDNNYFINPYDPYGYREDCPQNDQICVEVKRPGKRTCTDDPTENYYYDEYTLVELTTRYKGTDQYLSVSRINSELQSNGRIRQNDTVFIFELYESHIGYDFGIHCTTSNGRSEVDHYNAFQSCMQKPKENFLVEFGECIQTDSLDIVFVVDGSGSVGYANFETTKTFLKNFVHNLDIGKVQVGLVRFDTFPFSFFHLNSYNDSLSLQNAISNVSYNGGGTNMHTGLRHMRLNQFTAANGNRNEIPDVAIVLTDGIFNNPTAALQEAQIVAAAGIKIFSIGIGKGISESQLKAISSDPKINGTNYFLSTDFSSLVFEVKEVLFNELCKA